MEGTTSKSNGEILLEIFEQDRERVEKWLNHAVKCISLLMGEGDKTLTAKDVLHDILLKVISGDREWRGFTAENADAYMFKTIESHVYGLAKRAKRHITVEARKTEDEEWEDPWTDLAILPLEEILNDQDKKERLERAKAIVEHDTEMGLVFELMRMDMRDEDIAKELIIPEEEVKLIKRRIQYALKKNLRSNN